MYNEQILNYLSIKSKTSMVTLPIYERRCSIFQQQVLKGIKLLPCA